MQHTITLQNISETEQLVLRLIFSLSGKVAGREHSYRLSDAATGLGEILIRGSGPQDTAHTQPAGSFIQYMDSATPSQTSAYQINKPLIATRVLTVLDRYVSHELGQPAAVQPAATPESVEDAPQVEFCISEEEASELAIVEDEALANPANLVGEEIVQTGAAMQHAVGADAQPAIPVHTSSLLVFQRARAPDAHAEESPAPMVPEAELPQALVVDDSPSVRKQLELELDLFEVDVDYAADAAQAMEMLGAKRYDLAFLDVVLPDGDGFSICKSIKQDTKQMKVVMLTGKATPADKIKGTMAGCDAYLVKPVGRLTFQNTVCKYLQLREQAEAIQA